MVLIAADGKDGQDDLEGGQASADAKAAEVRSRHNANHGCLYTRSQYDNFAAWQD